MLVILICIGSTAGKEQRDTDKVPSCDKEKYFQCFHCREKYQYDTLVFRDIVHAFPSLQSTTKQKRIN
jgi:hypothetical protein